MTLNLEPSTVIREPVAIIELIGLEFMMVMPRNDRSSPDRTNSVRAWA